MADSERFDELSRIWAGPISRRRAMRLSAGVLLGAVGASLLPRRADALAGLCTTTADCTGADQCCDNPSHTPIGGQCVSLTSGVVCCDLTNGGTTLCTPERCCQGTCFDPGTVCCGGIRPCDAQCCGSSCCSVGTTCCGNTCCPPSKVCVNASTGACGCPPGGPTCGNFCCKKGETCSDPAGGCCCPKGSTPCGRTCCASGVACIDRTNGICGCQAGTTPCGTGASLTCCPAGTACHSGCPAPSNNTVAGVCSGVGLSDRNLKEHVAPVRWDQPGSRSKL